ncbi:MAG TPA: hypothetical protein VHE79_15455 [Spirochaetia bacterium]
MNGEREREWVDAYRLWEADRGFRSTRRRALAERLTAFLGRSRRRVDTEGRANGHADGAAAVIRSVPVCSVVGVLAEGAGRPLPLPARPRIDAWRRLFLADDPCPGPIAVRRAAGGCLLHDAVDALAVQALRARGIPRLAVRCPGPGVEPRCGAECPCDLTREIA